MLWTPNLPSLANQMMTTFLLWRKSSKLLDILQTISYDWADGFHYVVGVMQTESAYMADHEGNSFPIPKHLGLWGNKITEDVPVVEMKKAKAIHKARAKDYKIW
jgi:hypothetical protein